MRTLIIAALFAATGASAVATTGSVPQGTAALGINSLLQPHRLSTKPLPPSAADGDDSAATAASSTIPPREDIVPLHKEKAHKQRKEAVKRRSGVGNGGIASPTGTDYLFLDFLRFSAYERVVRSDGLLVSNTSSPLITVKLRGEEEEEGRATATGSDADGDATAAAAPSVIGQGVAEVPHLVQVWAVRVPQQELVADGAAPRWQLSPDATTTHYFAVEHTPTAMDRQTITGEQSLGMLGGGGGAPFASSSEALPFAIRGTAYAAPTGDAADASLPAWLSVFNKVRNGPVGAHVGEVSAYLQSQLLGAEGVVRRYWQGTDGEGPTARRAALEQRRQNFATGIGASSSLAPRYVLGVEDARLVAMSPTSATAGSFVVELALGTASPTTSAVSAAPTTLRLSGDYAFAPSKGFMANPKIDGRAASSPHNFFEYSLTFVSSGPIAQTTSTATATSTTATSAAPPPPPRCTHYRAVAQFDKKHILLTTYWEVVKTEKKAKEGAAAADDDTAAPSTFERTIVLNLQENAGEDVRFAGDGSPPELEPEEYQRFRFMDIDGPMASSAAFTQHATPRSVASVEGLTSATPSPPFFVNPTIRRVEMPFYYNAESEEAAAARRGLFGRFLPSISGRIRRLLPTVALLFVVILVKFGPKVYLNWLDAKQQKRKGAVSMKAAAEANFTEKEMAARRAARLAAASAKDGTGDGTATASANSLTEAAEAAAALAKANSTKEAFIASKGYGSGKHLAKVEALMQERMKDPAWRKGYEEAMARRKDLSQEERDDLKAQEKALIEQMMREDGLM